MNWKILTAASPKVRKPTLQRWKQVRHICVSAIGASQCDSNQSYKRAGVGRDERSMVWQK